MEIRPSSPADLDDVRALVVAAFGDHGPGVGALVGDLLSGEAVRASLVAVDAGAVVGHVALSRGWLDAEERLVEVAVLSPLSVQPARQGRGIGRDLLAAAVAVAEKAGDPLVMLEGDPGYYGRLGWEAAHLHGLERPSERIPRPACQVRLLASYRPWMRGRLVYPDLFWRHDSVGLRGDRLARVRASLGES